MNTAFRKFLMGSAIMGGMMMPARTGTAAPQNMAPGRENIAADAAPKCAGDVSNTWKDIIFFGAMGLGVVGGMAVVWKLTLGQARRDYRAMEAAIRDAQERARKPKTRE